MVLSKSIIFGSTEVIFLNKKPSQIIILLTTWKQNASSVKQTNYFGKKSENQIFEKKVSKSGDIINQRIVISMNLDLVVWWCTLHFLFLKCMRSILEFRSMSLNIFKIRQNLQQYSFNFKRQRKSPKRNLPLAWLRFSEFLMLFAFWLSIMSTLSFDIFSGEPLFESDFDLTGDVAKGEEEFCFCSATNWEVTKI